MIKITNLKQYIELAKETAIYPRDEEHTYIKMGLIGEVGECFNLAKKVLRDDNGVWTEDKKDSLAHELGDVCWYLAMFVNEYEINVLDEKMAFQDFLLPNKEKFIKGILFELFDDTAYLCEEAKFVDVEDAFMCISDISNQIGFKFSEVLEMNIEKLHSRKERGVIGGSGDNR